MIPSCQSPDFDAESRKIGKAAGIVFAATMASRILGFVRDAAIAAVFGAGGITDVFFLAFRFPNLLRKLFAEGILSIAFIPIFTEYYVLHGRSAACRLGTSVFKFLAVLLLLIIVIGIVWAPEIVRYGILGIDSQSSCFAVMTTLIRIMLPYLLFIGLASVSMGILNASGHFMTPALAPILLNLAIIGCIYLLSPQLSVPIYGAAVGIVIGGALQWLIQVPALLMKGWRWYRTAPYWHPALHRIAFMSLPVIISASACQINTLIISLLAAKLPGGSVSYLYYADRLIEFPLGLFSAAAAIAVLPSMTRSVSSQHYHNLTKTFEFSITLLLFLILPAMFGLMVMSEPIIQLLFQRGEFTPEAVRETSKALMAFCIGLWAVAGVRIMLSLFYSFQETKIPMICAVISIGVNVLLAFILIEPWGHSGLALSVSIASIVNFLLLISALQKQIKGISWKKIGKCTCKTMICSLIMAAIVWQLKLSVSAAEKLSVFNVLGIILAGMITYIILSKLFKSSELETMLNQLKTADNKGSCQSKKFL